LDVYLEGTSSRQETLNSAQLGSGNHLHGLGDLHNAGDGTHAHLDCNADGQKTGKHQNQVKDIGMRKNALAFKLAMPRDWTGARLTGFWKHEHKRMSKANIKRVQRGQREAHREN
jgi:hypothetical protein